MDTFTFADLYSALATIESNNQRIEVSSKQIGDGGVGVPALEKGSREAAIAIEMHRLRGETNALYESTFSRRAVSDLQVRCEAESGERLTTQKLRQFRASFCQRTGCSIHEANQTDVTEIVSELRKKQIPANDVIGNAASVQNGDESKAEVGNVKLLRKTGSGLYGVVWEAEQPHLQRKVAVKIINPSMQNAASALEHARALARVDSHENIVTVHDVAKVRCPGIEGLVDGIIMEWLEGERLGDRLSGSSFSITECTSVCSAILDGLEFMHSQDIVHGDLHAGNVMLTASSTKIIDIDVADEYSVSRLTSMSRDQRVAADIRNIGYVVWSVVRHSAIPLDRLATFESRFRSANSLNEIRESLDVVLANDESDRTKMTVPSPSSSQQIASNVASTTGLSASALEILRLAVESDGSILKGNSDRGYYVLVGGKSFAPEHNYEQAQLRDAMRELIMSRYVDEVTADHAKVSMRGYSVFRTESE